MDVPVAAQRPVLGGFRAGFGSTGTSSYVRRGLDGLDHPRGVVPRARPDVHVVSPGSTTQTADVASTGSTTQTADVVSTGSTTQTADVVSTGSTTRAAHVVS